MATLLNTRRAPGALLAIIAAIVIGFAPVIVSVISAPSAEVAK